MGKFSRNKGKSYEQQIARELREHGFPLAKRHLEYQGQEAEEGRDIDCTWPFAIQCKHTAKMLPVNKTIDQISPSEEYPRRIAIMKQTHGNEVVIMDKETFYMLLDMFNYDDPDYTDEQ